MRLGAAVAVFLGFAAAADACVLSLRFEEGEIRWKPVAGAERYQLQESFNDFTTSRNYFTEGQSFRIDRRVTAPTKVHYRVTAEVSALLANGSALATSLPACTATIDVDLVPDPDLRALTRRIVFPLVGSTPGAFGGRFKTYLKLTGSFPEQKGKIVFHPAGRQASDSDPSIAYVLNALGETREFDDIVAAMGQSGIGSLDIIPDEGSESFVPVAEARLYNDTAGGTFGTQEFPAFPADYLRPASLKLAAPDPRFRMNVGFRTLTDATLLVLVHGADARLRDFRELKFPAGWMQMTGAAELAGSELKAGETMTLTFTGAVVPFHTLTENRTNDPTLVVAEPRTRSLNVGAYVD